MDTKKVYEKGLAGKDRTSFTIVGSRIYQYVHCPTELYLNYFGPVEKKLPRHEFILKLIKKGEIHEEDVCAKLDLTPVVFEDLKKGFKETLKLMKKGENLIRHPILFHLKEDYMGIPDLIERNNSHKSVFGSYHYTVSDIKLSKHPKEKYVMQVTFYNYILGKVQGYTPKKMCLILGKEERKECFEFKTYWPKLKEKIEGMRKVLSGKDPSPIISSKSKMCEWRDRCFETAMKEDDVSLVWGLGEKSKSLLKKEGVKTLTDLVEADVEKLSKLTGLKGVAKWQMRAKALKEGKEIVIKEPELPEKPNEIYIDLEKSDETEKEWLIGILHKGRVKQLIAEKPEEEEKIWKEFKEYIRDKKDFTIYHYGSYEKTAIKKLSREYGIDERLKKKITENMKDVYNVLTDSMILPVHSTSLKNVAKYLGFRWKDDIDATGSMCLYDKWQQTGKKKYLKKALRYNKDDLMATEKVVEFLKKVSKK